MNTKIPQLRHRACLALLAALLMVTNLSAHCDSWDGPVVKAGQRALAERNVGLALIWVQQADEAEIRRVFDKTLAVRKLGAEALEMADTYFFETLVRLHRASEGESYTGLKAAGRNLGPAIPAGDKALETGKLEPVMQLLTADMKHGLRAHFAEAVEKKQSAPNDIAAGRAYVKAYVVFIHYVDGIHRAVNGLQQSHAGENESVHAHSPQPGEKR